MPQKIIIDTDPGIDDAMAIHYAFAHPELEVMALTSVFGNVWVEQATRNALHLAEQARHETIVAEGASEPLKIKPHQPSHYVHGDEGFGDLKAPKPSARPDPRPAHEVIADLCRRYPGEIILCPIGPLTNIARLLEYDPEITGFVKKVVLMGGAVHRAGNVTPHAEANIWNDPHAADRVFAADWTVEMIGLDITATITCGEADFAGLAKTSPQIGGFLHRIVDFYMKFHEARGGGFMCMMHDPTALVSITNPALIGYEDIRLEVATEGEEIGKTQPSSDPGRRPVRVAVTAEGDAVRKTFLDICAGSDRIAESR
jgi:inosine-uridine nucleoside N-ribohydrolase